MKKKWLSFLLAGLMLLTLTSCSLLSKELTDELLNAAVDAGMEILEDSLAETGDNVQPGPTQDAAGEKAEQPPSTQLQETPPPEEKEPVDEDVPLLPEDGAYTTKEDVALYIHLYGHLPDNFITKKEARKLGWEKGSLEPYAPGKCIGGDYFGNYEGLLPKDREYTECDIDTLGAESRGAKRIVFSDDGLIYYTPDHYESFELLYGEE